VIPVNGFAWGASGTAPALVFAGVVVWVLVAAAGIVVRQVSRLARRQAKPSLSRYEMAVLVLAGAGVLCIVYGRWVEPYRLEVTHIPLASPKLSAASRPIRIVQLSDLHCDPQQRLEPRLPAVVAAERPDLIVFTGDAINSPGAIPLPRRRDVAVCEPGHRHGRWRRAPRPLLGAPRGDRLRAVVNL